MSQTVLEALTTPELDVVDAPGGGYARLVRREDGLTLVWACRQKSGGVRLIVQAPAALVEKAGKRRLADSWSGGRGRVTLNVTEANVEQGKSLVTWLAENVPAKGARP